MESPSRGVACFPNSRDHGHPRTDPTTMPRRKILLFSVLVLALLATALAPWTLSSGGIMAAVSKHLGESYGLDLAVRGRSTLAILPVPRVKFEDVTLSSADRSVSVEGGTIRGEVRLLPLVFGRIELSDLSISGSRLGIQGDWARWLTERTAPRAEARLRRLVVTGSSLRGPDSGILDDINVVVSWPGGESRLDLAGSISWRGERMDITQASVIPASLVAGRPSPFSLTLKAPTTEVSLSRDLQTGSDPRITGTSRIDIRSVRDFVRWSGIELPLQSVIPAIGVEGEFSADRRRLSWPSVIVTLGPDRLEGTLALRFSGGRPALTGTLAADRLNLSDMLGPFVQSRTATGWSSEAVSLAAATGGDLDLRLSAGEANLGRLMLEDIAASVLVRPGRVEASLGRAGLYKGTLKGRLSVAGAGGAAEVKAQGAFDRVDLAPLLADLGRSRWVTGQASGQFMLEGGGQSAAEIVRQTSGRTSVMVRQGALVGVGLTDFIKRVEKRPLAASMEWKGGRTTFDLAQVTLNVANGIGEVSDATLTSPSLRASLHGQVSLVERAVALRAHVDPTPNPTQSPLVVFDVSGGFDDIAVIPDAKSLIERSGAAKPLFGERLAPARQLPSAPMATAH
jgi:AsmA protein